MGRPAGRVVTALVVLIAAAALPASALAATAVDPLTYPANDSLVTGLFNGTAGNAGITADQFFSGLVQGGDGASIADFIDAGAAMDATPTTGGIVDLLGSDLVATTAGASVSFPLVIGITAIAAGVAIHRTMTIDAHRIFRDIPAQITSVHFSCPTGAATADVTCTYAITTSLDDAAAGIGYNPLDFYGIPSDDELCGTGQTIARYRICFGIPDAATTTDVENVAAVWHLRGDYIQAGPNVNWTTNAAADGVPCAQALTCTVIAGKQTKLTLAYQLLQGASLAQGAPTAPDATFSATEPTIQTTVNGTTTMVPDNSGAVVIVQTDGSLWSGVDGWLSPAVTLVTVPDCGDGTMTYTTCAQLLRNGGLVGEITPVETTDPAATSDQTGTVEYTQPFGGVSVYPTVTVSTALYASPDGSPAPDPGADPAPDCGSSCPAPSSGTATTTDTGTQTTTDQAVPACNCPPLDFTPLQHLNYDNNFPFGVFGYVTSTLDLFDVSPTAPSFDISVPGVGGAHPISAPGHYAGDLGFLVSYMAIVRDLEAFALWIGGIWWIGGRFIGFHNGDDAMGAADDGSVV
jgi:hypothetical protein